MEELDCPDLNPIEHLWDELERLLRARPNRPTTVPGLTNALVAEWHPVGNREHGLVQIKSNVFI